jgi:GDP-L-fucose synthase
MQESSKIYVAGHLGLVGSAIVRALNKAGYENITSRTHTELDLCSQTQVDAFFAAEKPEFVFLAAAKVGGILANDLLSAEFIQQNLLIQTLVIDAAWRNGVKKLLFLGSSCIYPRFAPQPMPEDSMLTGGLEPTNQWYAIAKIAGIKMCQAYRKQYGFDAVSVMPTNLYGPGDNFHPEYSHVLPAMIRRFHEARQADASSVTIWGTGTPRREFLHVDDMAEACVFVMDNYSGMDHLNIGRGTDVTIMELAVLVAKTVGFQGEILNDPSRPDGMPQKLLDTARLTRLGWQAKISLEEGLAQTYEWYLQQAGHREK